MSIQAHPLSFADRALLRQKNNTRHEEMSKERSRPYPELGLLH